MPTDRKPPLTEPRYGLARVLSKRGLCSRTQATQWVRDGRVKVNGKTILDPEHPTLLQRDRVELDQTLAGHAARVYLMLNKPRGLVTTARDERGRDTVYRCFDGAGLPWLAPVGRLDQASEGLLLFCNDPAWAAAITDGGPTRLVSKTYHVQVDCIPDAAKLSALAAGVIDAGELLTTESVTLLRSGQKNAWLEIVLAEGRNRHIRRLLAALGMDVLRLLRVAIGPLPLGDLAKGQWRYLSEVEVRALADPSP